MSLKKPSESEEEYFVRVDAEKRRKLAIERGRAMEEAERAQLKALHYMHCPKCGFNLETVQFQGLAIDRCFNCSGAWFDKGEFEHLVSKQPDFLGRLMAVFKADQ